MQVRQQIKVWPQIQCVWLEKKGERDAAPVAIVNVTKGGIQFNQDNGAGELDPHVAKFVTEQIARLVETFGTHESQLEMEVETDEQW